MNRHDVDRSALPGDGAPASLGEQLRAWLGAHWPIDGAIERAGHPEALAALWQGLADQGIAALGADPRRGGLREVAAVMEELGRAACPVPLLGHLMGNLVLARAAARGEQMVDAGVIRRLHGGAMRLTIAFAAGDAPGNGGDIEVVDGRARGLLRFVDHGLHATHLLLALADALLVIDLREPGAAVIASPVFGGPGWTEVRLEQARADVFAMESTTLADVRLLARFALVARAHGAARRAFELAVEHARQRHQFGQPIGRFQAIQHKLADGLIALEGVRLTVAHAAQAYDHGERDWRYFASAAIAFGAQALRQVSLETHHTFGAAGYDEDHEAPRHFRQVHRDTIVLGGGAVARQELAARLLDDDAAALPEYDLGAAGNGFRATVRDWLDKHWSGKRKAAFERQPFDQREFDAAFALDLGRAGWLGLSWPREFGGQARSPREQLAFLEMMERAETPRFGAPVQAAALMLHGTPAQRERWLPEILRGEAMHGIGYSEPEAGSDLAALATTAVRVHDERGDGWLINGRKVWTTTWWGQYLFVAARTDPDSAAPHEGIGMFIVPMAARGIGVQPGRPMNEGSFATVTFDDVWVSADHVIGRADGGWQVLTDALASERALLGASLVIKVAHAFDLLCRDLRNQAALRRDPLVRDRVGQLAAEVEVGRQLMIRGAELAERGAIPPEFAAISKVFSSELMERFGEAAMDLLGPRAALSQYAPGALRGGRYEQNLRHAIMWTIATGTNEIQRTLIAQRALGLPADETVTRP